MREERVREGEDGSESGLGSVSEPASDDAAFGDGHDAVSGSACAEDSEASSLGVREPGREHLPSLVRRIFISLSLASSVAAIVVLMVASFVFQGSAIDDAGRMLESECKVVRSVLRGDGSDGDVMRLVNLDMGEIRLTFIDKDGSVLYDNQGNVDDMGNHAGRPEVQEATDYGEGSAERESATEGMVSIYRAVRLDDGRIVRLSVNRDSAMAAISHDVMLVVLVVLVVLVACWLVARAVASRLIKPVLDIDPAHPGSPYVEVMPLVERISEQQSALEAQVAELRGADLMRREFTSNVTHELKTPLASISGAAELIRDGIARPEDVSEFAGRIYDEAGHMTELVNDILTLSKLDESERAGDRSLMGTESPVDLHHVALDVARRLETQANAAKVKIRAKGDPVVIKGVPRLLDELVYNLSDNAIRYNREHGKVEIWTGVEDGRPVLRVSDTGIGIPKASRAKVFERFYRVDKGRSRETGGTGLGLAIVKHAVAYHGGEVTLQSKEGKGTTFTVRFPASSLA